MDAIKEFDVELKKSNSYTILGSNLLKYIFCFVGFSMALIMTDDLKIMIFTYLYFALSADFHIKPYICIKQNDKNIPIFPLLRDTPLSKKDFIRSRFKYLLPFALKLLIIFAISRAIAIFAFETVSLENILNSIFYIVLLAFFIFLSCMTDIYSSTRYKRE